MPPLGQHSPRQFRVGQSTARITATKVNCHLGNCHPAQLTPRTIVTWENCHPDNHHLENRHPGQLPPGSTAVYRRTIAIQVNCHPDNYHLQWDNCHPGPLCSAVFSTFLLQRNLAQMFALLMEPYAMIQVSILLSVIYQMGKNVTSMFDFYVSLESLTASR